LALASLYNYCALVSSARANSIDFIALSLINSEYALISFADPRIPLPTNLYSSILEASKSFALLNLSIYSSYNALISSPADVIES
jgi:hypothetical protein